MNSSTNARSTQAGPDDAVLVRDAGFAFRPRPPRDPIAAWMDLMEVVQMLCPVWLVRTEPMRGSDWRL
jgi:hypothetical protein